MNLNLRELASKGEVVELRGRFMMDEASAFSSDIRRIAPVEARLTVHWDSGTAIVAGTLTANLELVCSRCLRTVEERVEYPVTEMFTLQRSIADSDDDIHLVNEEVIDLTPYLRDAFIVQLPMAAVCDPDCKGLCPECGKDRNTETCDCVQDKIDPRLAALKDFFNS